MTLDKFKASLTSDTPPSVPTPLLGLWYDALGDWDRAHQTVQDDPSAASAWVHAYLHRKEGDITNAHYWYRRAGKPPYNGSLESEWEQIVQALLEQVYSERI
ncbi:MAG: hypothetical protein KatS3mg019_0183 [Fimbriimonadales bacterium]|nr:MAG: hypothetical protein KatS3mg019_0183 [Fimbriimonadales bacterium]